MIPASCVLDINNDAIKIERIWVRVSAFTIGEIGIGRHESRRWKLYSGFY